MQYARERAQGLLKDLLKKKGIVSSSEDEIVCEAIVNFIITAAAHETTMYVGLDRGAAVATEYDPEQMRLSFPEKEEETNIRQLAGAK